MTVLVDVAEQASHVLLTMDDGKANALSFAMLEALNQGLDQAAAAGKVVVITGREGKFCAGFDLTVMAGRDEQTMKLLRAGADLSSRLMSFETPVVLAVSGHALAMGALICLSGDYRIGVRGAFKLGLNEAAIGMALPWFGVELARARLAQNHLDQAVNLARIYDPETAVAAGYLDEAVEPTELLERATQIAEAAAQLDMPSHQASKSRVREPLFERWEEALRRDFSEFSTL